MANMMGLAATGWRHAEPPFRLRDGTVDAWRAELDAAAAIAADDTVGRMLANPAVALETRTDIAEATFGKVVGRPTLNLIGLMLRRGRIEQLPRVAAEFRRLDNARQGITLTTATSASPLTPDEVRALTERMEQFTGGRVELDLQVDPSLLGGLVVRVGDRLIDGSVRGRLERLRNQLVSGAL
jgi:F-type H+-transporting ATPase subunit delta